MNEDTERLNFMLKVVEQGTLTRSDIDEWMENHNRTYASNRERNRKTERVRKDFSNLKGFTRR